MRSNLKVYTTKIQGHNVLTYKYRASKDIAFEFHLLCEVGQPWYLDAKHLRDTLAKLTNSTITVVELDTYPWVIEVLNPNPNPNQH